MQRKLLYVLTVLALAGGAYLSAQQIGSSGTPATPVTVQVQYPVTAITATAAVNTATTLTIPAPPGGWYNYVCYLAYQVNNDNTATAVSNVVSTSTNFGTFATKFSAIATASIDSGVITIVNASTAQGCPKSAASGTATTFVSPAALTHSAWTWYAQYYQAP